MTAFAAGPPLRRADLDPDPLVQIRRWADDAAAAGVALPTTVVLTTVGADGRPSARYVPLRSIDGDGLVFTTDTRSRKGQDLLARPDAVTVLFPWLALGRQVSVAGRAELLDDAASDTLFAGGRRPGQIRAAALPPPGPVTARRVLEDVLATAVAADDPAATRVRPPTWRGVRIVASEVEVWQAGGDEIHDRFRYVAAPGGWSLVRLVP